MSHQETIEVLWIAKNSAQLLKALIKIVLRFYYKWYPQSMLHYILCSMNNLHMFLSMFFKE
jgi:hypothetical protein